MAKRKQGAQETAPAQQIQEKTDADIPTASQPDALQGDRGTGQDEKKIEGESIWGAGKVA